MQSEETTFTLQTLLVELRHEYLKSVRVEAQAATAVVAYADIQVWFYNRDSQRALPVVKRIWDKVPGSPIGTKALDDFLIAYAKKLMQRHSRYSQILMDVRLMKECLNRASDVLTSMRVQWGNELVDSPSCRRSFDWSGAIEKYQTQQSFTELLALVYIKDAQLSDLESAFTEGFSGYSLSVATSKATFETAVKDVFGNSVLWSSVIQLPIHVDDLPVCLVMHEHALRNSCLTKTPVAKLEFDAFGSLLHKPALYEGYIDLQLQGSVVKTPLIRLSLPTTSSLMRSSPAITLAVAFSVQEPKHQVEVIKRRVEGIRERLNQLKGDLQKTNTSISLQTSAFPRVRYDEKKLFLAREERFKCFSSCIGKKDKKCLVM